MYSLFTMVEVIANKALSHHEIIYPVHKSKKKQDYITQTFSDKFFSPQSLKTLGNEGFKTSM